MQSSMEIEIIEQPCLIGNLIRKHVQNYVIMLDMPLNVKKVKFIASGSSYNCAQIAKKFFEEIALVDADVEFSGEFLYDKKPIDSETLYFFISQSGETYDTVEACNKVKSNNTKTYAIVNNNSSTLYDMCDYKIDVMAGVERSIAATKSFSTTLVALYLCALKIAQNKLINIAEYMQNIDFVEKNVANVLDMTTGIDEAATHLSKYKAFPIIGHGYNYALAREASLKTKETSFIDANAYAMGEFLHGHVAILNKVDTLIEIVTQGFNEFETKTISKVKADYNPKSVVITDSKEDFDEKIKILFPHSDDLITRLLSTIMVFQTLALKIAQKLKRDIDNPNGLSKVVK